MKWPGQVRKGLPHTQERLGAGATWAVASSASPLDGDSQLAKAATGEISQCLRHILEAIGALNGNPESSRCDFFSQAAEHIGGRHCHDRGRVELPVVQLIGSHAESGRKATSSGDEVRQQHSVSREMDGRGDAVWPNVMNCGRLVTCVINGVGGTKAANEVGFLAWARG